MSALLAFAQDKNQRVYFNGFAIYCMEIACSFLKVYKDQLGKIPPGLEEDSLIKFNNLMLQSDRSIGEYRNKRKIHPDFEDFYVHVNGNLGNTQLQDKLKDSEKKCAFFRTELQKYKDIVEKIKDPLDTIKSNVDDLNHKVDYEIHQNGQIIDVITQNQTYILDLIADMKVEFAKFKSEGKINDTMFQTFFDAISTRFAIIEKISGIGKGDRAVSMLIQDLRRENDELKTQIEDLKKTVSSTATPPPPAALSNETRTLLNKCNDYVDLKFTRKMPELFQDAEFSSLKTDFSGLESEFPGLLQKILVFCRDSFCFFHTLEKFKKKEISEISDKTQNDMMKLKIKNQKIQYFFDNTILCSEKILEKINKVFHSDQRLKSFLMYKMDKIKKKDDNFEIKVSDIHNIGLSIFFDKNEHSQWKESFLHAECTLHHMKHQLMFMFTLHLIRLIKVLSQNLKDDATAMKETTDDTIDVLIDIFCSIMNEDTRNISSVIFNPEYTHIISDFFSEYPKDEQRKVMYPLKLFHMGAYMKYTPRSYPYLLDLSQNKININIFGENEKLRDVMFMDDHQLFTLLFKSFLQTFHDKTKPSTSTILI